MHPYNTNDLIKEMCLNWLTDFIDGSELSRVMSTPAFEKLDSQTHQIYNKKIHWR